MGPEAALDGDAVLQQGLGEGGPAAAQGELEEGAEDTPRTLAYVRQVRVQREALHPRARDEGLQQHVRLPDLVLHTAFHLGL